MDMPDGGFSRTEFRPLEGFVLAVTPFNFVRCQSYQFSLSHADTSQTAIGGNLVGAPAIVGNVVIWKPSPMATYSNYLIHKILLEAGMPPPVIQFVPGSPPDIVGQCIDHKEFGGLHFTGSTQVFRSLWKRIAGNLDVYGGYPRVVGETGECGDSSSGMQLSTPV